MIFDHETDKAKRLAKKLGPETDDSLRGEMRFAIDDLLSATRNPVDTCGTIEARWAFRIARELERRGALEVK